MRVIARAYEDQPLDRVVVGEEGDTVFLVNPSVNRTQSELEEAGVGFPRFCVYPYSSELLIKLQTAWDGSSRAALVDLWGEASRLQAYA